jgi:RNA polymerase sigma factor (sigma-70 family)
MDVISLPPFEAVVDEYGTMVMRVCRAVLGSDNAAEDAWSETFISALRAYPDLRPDSDVRAWLVTIAHRKAIDQIRARNRAPLPTADPLDKSSDRAGLDGPGPDGPGLDGAGLDGDLRTAVNRLPTKQRHAVAYRYLADLSYADIGALLDCSVAAARRSAADGIAALRSIDLQPSRSTHEGNSRHEHRHPAH